MLQWGRAQSSAEMDGFWVRDWGARMLQWGRAQSSAEMIGGAPTPPPKEIASMGPRPIERGNLVEFPSLPVGRRKLQWGRAQSSAEIARRMK